MMLCFWRIKEGVGHVAVGGGILAANLHYAASVFGLGLLEYSFPRPTSGAPAPSERGRACPTGSWA